MANVLYDIVWTNRSLQLKLNGSVVATSTVVPRVQAMCFNLAVGDNSSGDSGYYRMDYVGTTAIPEPSALVLAATGLLGLLAYAWRKRK